MRYRFLILLFALSLSACSFEVDVVTPPANATLPPNTPVVVSSQTDTPIPTAIPSLTPSTIPTPLQEVGGIYPIQFAPNGTYVDLVDSLNAGTSRTYSVEASQGQVMSISLHLSPYTSWTE
jgi:hypothetical protein